MADIHVLSGDGIDKWTIVFHFAVPNINNEVAVNYRTALVNSGHGGTSVLTEGTGAGEITTAELAQIQAGELYEHTVSFLAESGATSNLEMIAEVQALYAARETVVINRAKKVLRYYGYTGSA